MNVIEIKDLSIRFKDRTILQNISLNVSKGEIVILIGPSGCGKSTLLRTIAGTIPNMIGGEVTGTVKVSGRVDMMFQEGNLLPWRDVVGNVMLGNEVLNRKVEETRIVQLIKSVGLVGFEKYYPRQLSGGMRQRVALASTLITSPEVLLMDEPFGSLDALTREEMWILLEKVRSEGIVPTTSVLVTHSIEEAVVLGSSIVILKGSPGSIVDVVKVDVERPRFNQGTLRPECLEIANYIRTIIR